MSYPRAFKVEQNIRLWAETVAGLASAPEGEITFEDAFNAFSRQISLEGGAIDNVQYQAFMGPDGFVVHAVLVLYYAETQVSYAKAIEALEDAEEDREADYGFVAEDLSDVLRGLPAPEEVEE